MGDSVIQFLERLFDHGEAWVVFFGSAIPVTEQRATVPLGILQFGMDPLAVFLLSLAGSALPVPFLLLFFTRFLAWLRRFPRLDPFSNFLDNRVRQKARQFETRAEVFLIIFVAIPLPGTGLWTGSMVASFLGFDFRKSFLCVVLGGVLSAAALTLVFWGIRDGLFRFLS